VRIRQALVVLLISSVATMLAAGPALAATFSVQALDSHGGPPFHFSPSTVTIHVGDAVVWHNGGTVPHTATGAGFDSGTLDPGQSFSHTFTSAGSFAYHCQFHASLGMVGTVVVVVAASTTPPATSPAGSGGGATSAPPGAGGTTSALPNTGDGNSSVPITLAGAALVLLGGGTLLVLRRRAA
jgi:LPXTG-motif cell wall-anchored protein